MTKRITKPSEALRAAAKLIKRGSQRHTCYALESLCQTGAISGTTVQVCRLYIRTLLRRYATLEDWLRHNAPECRGMHLWSARNSRKVKRTRLAWIEWMAQQFEAQGR